MDTARWKRINELFDQACEHEPATRDAFLKQACADDPGLYDEVLALLESDARAQDALDDVFRDATGTLSDSFEGSRIGPWRLEREVGRGGMGSVYLARRDDGQFDQTVALKLIRRGMDSEQILRRFRMERQILARLQHPNIAGLLDGGITEDGQPWFAMEYVEGEPIDRYCDHHRLTIEQRLALFLDVCRAVMHAHANLVVHRDLKPDNIMVTADGQVRLLDFGIARVIVDEGDTTRLTQAGLRVMTPSYASPEQVRGEVVGTATDIYSLGVILYELLAGVRPYELAKRSLVEVERLVCETDPEKPSTRFRHTTGQSSETGEAIGRARGIDLRRLRRRLAGDLDVICLEAVRKEPDRRYGSVEAFHEDIRRHLAGLPVLARPDTLGYRVRKGLQRNRVAVIATAAVVLSIATLVAFYTVRLGRERDRARLEAAKAGEVASFLQGLFEVSDPSQSLGETVTARALLDEGANRVEEALADQPEVQATMMRVIGEVYKGLGLFEEARPLLAQALERSRTLYGEEHEEVATSKVAYATLLQDVGDVAAAEPLFREALATRERLFGRRHPGVAESLSLLGYLIETNGDSEGAEQIYRDALVLYRELYPADDVHVAEAMVELGSLLRHMERMDEAEPLLREGLALQRRHYSPTHPELASTVRNLAALLRDKGEYEEADTLYREALAIRRAVLGPNHPEVATTLNSYALLLVRKGDIDRALETFREFIAALEVIYTEPHPNLAAAYHNLASTLSDAGRQDEAIPLFRRSIEVADQALPEGHPNRARPLIGLAGVLLQQERYREAEPLYRRALELRRAALPDGHRDIGEAMIDLGGCIIPLGRYGESEQLLLEGLQIMVAAEGEDDSRTRGALRRLVRLYEAWERPADASRYRDRLAG